MQDNGTTNVFWILALGGFIPFAALTAAAYQGLDTGLAFGVATLFQFWSLAILSFLGGIRWGIAITAEPVGMRIAIASVVPCIIGWFSLALSQPASVLVLGFLFLAHGLWDVRAFAKTQLAWFAPIRMVLTGLVFVAHVMMWLKLAAF